MADPAEEFEPLFDYSRVQPVDVVCLDDDDDSLDDSPVLFLKKKRKLGVSNVEKKVEGAAGLVQVVDCDDDNDEEEEEDWLPPPPKISDDTGEIENSTLKELRLKKQELASFAESAEDVLQAVEETVKRDLGASSGCSTTETVTCERAKIVISIQDKDGLKHFRVYKDDKLERFFKTYAEKIKLDIRNLAFSFDGDKISPTATPDSLGMEDEDIIEVHRK